MSEKTEYTEIPELTKIYKERIIARVDEWLGLHIDESFLPQDIFDFYGWRFEPAIKKVVVNHLYYLAKTQSPSTLKKSGKQYRVIDRSEDTIEWKKGNPTGYVDILLPFDLHKYIRLRKRNLMLVAGVWGEGKTTFMHNIISLNILRHELYLFDSENSEDELAERWEHYPNSKDWPEDFAKTRSANFADSIRPDAINLIDYLEIPDNFYLVNKPLREIRDALKDGIAIVALQKKRKAEMPVGGIFAMQLPRVVVAIDKNELVVVKAKSRAQRTINPINMKWSFRIDDTGTKFLDVKRKGYVETDSEFPFGEEE